MGLFDRFRDGFGVQRPLPPDAAAMSADEQAIARYRYMLKTAPPETIEQAHAEAFAQLSPEQRRRVLQELAEITPAAERPAVMRAGESPFDLARVATRAEIRNPGAMERIFGNVGPATGTAGPGMGSLFAGSFLSSMAGTVLGSMIAQHFFSSRPEASHLFGDSGFAGDSSLAHTVDDATSRFDSDAVDLGGSSDGFDSGFDGGGTFDV